MALRFRCWCLLGERVAEREGREENDRKEGKSLAGAGQQPPGHLTELS